MKWFDTHAHLTDPRFKKDEQQLIASFEKHDISLVINCAAEEGDWPEVSRMSKEYPMVYATYGVHPHSAEEVSTHYLDRLAQYMQEEKAVAVGEIGLDYHYDLSPRDVQKRVLREQIEWAIANQYPVVLHEREAHEDMFLLLQDYKTDLCGVLHCYSGSVEMMPRFLDLNLYLGFGGTSTFKNAQKTKKVAQAIPIERMLLETDSPYLTPEPYRGKRNDPTYIPVIGENMAQLRNMSVDEVAHITTENGKRLFQI